MVVGFFLTYCSLQFNLGLVAFYSSLGPKSLRHYGNFSLSALTSAYTINWKQSKPKSYFVNVQTDLFILNCCVISTRCCQMYTDRDQ